MLEILPIISVTGHVSYLKSLYLYSQKMFNLPSENTKVHNMFVEGKLMKETELHSIAEFFCSNSCPDKDIAEAGILFYDCKTLESTDKLHHQIQLKN